MRTLATAALALALPLLPGTPRAEDDDALGFERTPPRLALVDGQVSFWRNGADDWAPARLNMPLAGGDELYAGPESSLEVQIGARAFARAGERTQLGVLALEPDYLQLRLAHGTASLDLRSIPAGWTIEVATPHGAFAVDRSGYYRFDVDDAATRFSSRRGGYARVTSAGGETATIAPSEQVIVASGDGDLESYAAPPLDDWDRWNYARTDAQLEAQSSRYVPAGVYGVDDLDQYGSWRVVSTYGPVWVPRVVSGWVPYSSGDWIYDPYYGWTWVDDAPWGWAPFHYGRWVYVDRFWAWCPGPRVTRVYYAPALVAFYGAPTLAIASRHSFGWVALGYGEPIVPWWGPSHWRHRPHWGGWGGPRVVNHTVVHNTTIVNVTNITKYEHASRRGAIVAVNRGDFGRRRVHDARIATFDGSKLRPMGDREFGVRPSSRSLVASDRRGQRPPRGELERTVITTREPRRGATPNLDRRGSERREREQDRRAAPAQTPAERPNARVVRPEPQQRRDEQRQAAERPRFGRQGVESRETPAAPPRFDDVRQRNTRTRERPPEVAASPAPTRERVRPQREARAEEPRRSQQPPPQVQQRERPNREAQPRERPVRERPQRDGLPGEPASRVYQSEQRVYQSEQRVYQSEQRVHRAEAREQRERQQDRRQERQRDATAQRDAQPQPQQQQPEQERQQRESRGRRH